MSPTATYHALLDAIDATWAACEVRVDRDKSMGWDEVVENPWIYRLTGGNVSAAVIVTAKKEVYRVACGYMIQLFADEGKKYRYYPAKSEA